MELVFAVVCWFVGLLAVFLLFMKAWIANERRINGEK